MSGKYLLNLPFGKILNIRIKQLYREILDTGLFRALILMGILLPLFFLFLYNRLTLPGYNHIITGLWLFIIFFVHRNRKDNRFFQKIANYPTGIYFGEYLLASFPMIIMLFVTRQYWHPLFLAAGIAGIGFTQPQPRALRTYQFIIRYIPDGMFEWQSGVRQNLLPVAIIYILGMAGIYKIWFSLIAVFLLTLLITSFYGACEPVKMLEAGEKDPTRFLWHKIKTHCRWVMLFMLPHFLIAMIHYEYWAYILICFPVMMNLIISAILLKYAYYQPGNTTGIHQLIGSIALILSVILPIAILILLANIFWYRKALHQLNFYLHAYHS